MAIYKNIDKLGSGGFGEVWLCEREDDGKRFAKKRLIDTTDNEAAKRFAREVRMLETLDHPNVVKVIGKNLVKQPYFFVMPLYETRWNRNSIPLLRTKTA